MQISNIVKNIMKVIIMVVAILGLALIGNIGNYSKENNQIKIQKITKEIQIEKNSKETRKQSEVTARHSISRNIKKFNLQETITESINDNEGADVVEKHYTKIEDIYISRDMDLTVRTGISKEDFKLLISNVKYDTSKFFYNNSDYIYDLCEEYEINEIFFCGLISAESGWNIAANHRRTHNYISLMTKNGLIKYNSVEEGLLAAAKALHNNYLTEGGRFYHGKTLYGVKTKFCPASTTWVELVYGRMQQMI